MSTDAKVTAIAPWFGGKRTLASDIVAELGPHTQYFEPFCGSAAVLFAKERAQKETINDLHGDLVNLARVLRDRQTAEDLYGRLSRTLFCEDLLKQAKDQPALEANTLDEVATGSVERAYWYFLASWMGRNGTAGTARADYQLAVRWTCGGGSPTVRWRNAIDSIPAWHQRLADVVILQRDAFSFLHKFEDSPRTAVYVDPPYHLNSRNNRSGGKGSIYKHEFTDEDHRTLARTLAEYKQARIVVSYYDCDEIRDLYQGWTFVDHSRQKHLHLQNGRGARPLTAPEVLIINGPSFAGEPASDERKASP